MVRTDEKLRGSRVLLAEDDGLLSLVLSDNIELAGGAVVGPAKRERDILALLEREGADCILLDLNLGDGPCYALVDTLIERGIPIILVTGYTASNIPKRFHHLPLFTKPYLMKQLVESVAECCRPNPPMPAESDPAA